MIIKKIQPIEPIRERNPKQYIYGKRIVKVKGRDFIHIFREALGKNQ